MTPEERSAEIKKLERLNQKLSSIGALPCFDMTIVDLLNDGDLAEAVSVTASHLVRMHRVLGES